jgi:hypothetical protein
MEIFIVMKNRKLTLRITESQFRTLCDRILLENTTKSNYIRNLLDESEQNCRKENEVVNNFKNTKNKLLNIIKGK